MWHTQDVLLEITLPRWQMSAPQDIDPASECSLLCEVSWFDSNDIELSSFVRSLKKADYGPPQQTAAIDEKNDASFHSQIKRNKNKQNPNENKPHALTDLIDEEVNRQKVEKGSM